MAGEVATLQTEYKKWLRDGKAHEFFQEHVKEELGDVLWYVANLAAKYDLPLEEIAAANIEKTSSRWLDTQERSESWLLDGTFPPEERLPREFVATIEEDPDGLDRKAILTIDDERIGDELDSNSYEEDGYKYHDVFHLAHMTVLGWSPVIRKLMGRKRKSAPEIDKVEDGGRAIVIDEAIVAFVFDYASRHNYLEGLRHVDYELLRALAELTSRLEVGVRSERDWELTILRGYEVWRKVRDQKGGKIRGNLVTGEFEFVG